MFSALFTIFKNTACMALLYNKKKILGPILHPFPSLPDTVLIFGLVWFGTLELSACLQPPELTKIPDSGLPWLWN